MLKRGTILILVILILCLAPALADDSIESLESYEGYLITQEDNTNGYIGANNNPEYLGNIAQFYKHFSDYTNQSYYENKTLRAIDYILNSKNSDWTWGTEQEKWINNHYFANLFLDMYLSTGNETYLQYAGNITYKLMDANVDSYMIPNYINYFMFSTIAYYVNISGDTYYPLVSQGNAYYNRAKQGYDNGKWYYTKEDSYVGYYDGKSAYYQLDILRDFLTKKDSIQVAYPNAYNFFIENIPNMIPIIEGKMLSASTFFYKPGIEDLTESAATTLLAYELLKDINYTKQDIIDTAKETLLSRQNEGYYEITELKYNDVIGYHFMEYIREATAPSTQSDLEDKYNASLTLNFNHTKYTKECEYSVDDQNGTLTLNSNFKSTLSISFNEQGEHTLEVSCTNHLSTIGTDKFILNIDWNDAPTVIVSDTFTVPRTELVEITTTGTDPENDSLWYIINDTRFNKKGNTFVWQTTKDDAGVYYVKISASDRPFLQPGALWGYKVVKITIQESPDLDEDGIIDQNDDDMDGDGLTNDKDPVTGNVSTLNTNMNLTLYIDNSTDITHEYTGKHIFEFKDNGTTILKFFWNFTEGIRLDWSINYDNENGTLTINNLELQDAYPKTVYLKKKESKQNTVCVVDAETSAYLFTNACTGEDEVLIKCNGNTGNYTCTNEGAYFKVTGLTHSILQGLYIAPPSTGGGSSSNSGGSSGGSGGSSSGSSNSVKTPEEPKEAFGVTVQDIEEETQKNEEPKNKSGDQLTGATVSGAGVGNIIFGVLFVIILISIILFVYFKIYKNKPEEPIS